MTDSDAEINSVNENAATGTSVGVTAFASDADGTNNDVTYSLSDDAGGRFAIDEVSGEVYVADGSLLDHETTSSFNVTVVATSSDGSTSSEIFSIDVADVNEAPTGLQVELASGFGNDLIVNGSFENSNVNSGSIKNFSSVDGWNASSGYVQIHDNFGGHTASEGSQYLDIDAETGIDRVYQDVTTVADQNYQLSFDAADRIGHDTNAFEVYWNGEKVADVDPSSTDWSAFEFDVVGTGGVDRLEFREASGGNDAFGALVDNVQLRPVIEEAVLENAAIGTLVATLTAEDVDENDTHTYSLIEDAGGAFTVDANTGEITVADSSVIDYETAQTMDVLVQVTDSGGLTYNEVVTINIADINEFDVSAVSDSDAVANAVSESAVVGTSVGITAFASDDDGTSSDVSYTLSSNPGNAFSINSTTGEVTVADPSALDFENSASMQIEVTATSEDGSTSSETFSIAINDANEFAVSAVTDSDAANNSVNENAAIGTSVGVTALASDSDGTNNDVTYSLSSNPGNAFSINSTTGEVTVADPSALDFESAQSMAIEVTATSQDGSTSSETFNIAINDVNEGAIVSTADTKGYEDSAIPLTIKISDVEAGAIVDVTISGVPSGAVLSAGTDNGDGSWTLEQADLQGLTITPPENSDADFVLGIKTNVVENGSTLTYKNTVDVAVVAQADAPSINGPESIVNLQGSSINFEGGLGNVDTLGTVNNPTGFSGQAPTEGSQFGELRANGASDLQIELEMGLAVGSLDTLSTGNATDGSSLQTAIVVKEGDVVTFDWNFVNSETAFHTQTGFNDFAIVNINGAPQVLARSSDLDGPGSTGWNTFTFTATDSGVLDLGVAMINTNDQQVDSSLLIDNFQVNAQSMDVSPVGLNLNIALSDADGSESLAIEVSGVPIDAALNTGTDLGGGVWSVDPADVGNLQLVPSATTSGTVSLTITATTTEAENGDTSTVSQTLDVTFETLDSVTLGTAGVDIINGDASNDIIAGKDGADVISGGDGHDYISGGNDSDLINGGAGDDQLFGDAGVDVINGDAGNDIIDGGLGDDVLNGGDGNDIFIFDQGDGSDLVDGGAGNGWVDSIDLSNTVDGAKDPSSPWQIEVNGEAVDYDINAGLLELGTDVSGVIQFDDGSQLTFENIETLEW